MYQQMKKHSHYIKGVVLDVGAGSFDRYSDLFSCEKYLRVDIDPKNKPDIVASAENIPLGDRSVDSVVSTQVLEHVKEPEAAIYEFYRILKPGGYVLATVPQWGELHEQPNDYYRFTNFGIRYLFEKVGFRVIELEQRGGFFSVMAQTRTRYLMDRFNLPEKNLWFFLLWLPVKICGRLAIFLDRIDTSTANRKHALGWCVLAKKS